MPHGGCEVLLVFCFTEVAWLVGQNLSPMLVIAVGSLYLVVASSVGDMGLASVGSQGRALAAATTVAQLCEPTAANLTLRAHAHSACG